MSGEYPRHHKGHVSFSQQPDTTLTVWSYSKGKGREYYFAFVGPDTHTICQGKFAVVPRKKPKPTGGVSA